MILLIFTINSLYIIMDVLYGNKIIKYKIKQIFPGLFAIEVPNQRDLALLFLRVQEFYESPNPEFQNNVFDIADFLQWYEKSSYHLNIDENSIEKSKGKSLKKSIEAYVNDWSGFNFPLSVAKNCYMKLFKFNENRKKIIPLTIYDKVFLEILDYIEYEIEQNQTGKNQTGKHQTMKTQKSYIIGARNFISPTMRHEIFHALYYLNDEYRDLTNKLIDSLPRSLFEKYKRNLKNMGYRDGVIKDELQSYLGTGDWNFEELNVNIDLSISQTLHHLFKNTFEYVFYSN